MAGCTNPQVRRRNRQNYYADDELSALNNLVERYLVFADG